jgi:aldose 1-epimerase
MFLIIFSIILISFKCILTQNSFNKYPKREDFQDEIDGKKVDLYFLTNINGYEISITNYGGIIVSIMAPNRENQFENIVNGFSTLKEYINHHKNGMKINSLLGRYANQIKNGEFILDNKLYKINDNSNFGEKVWIANQINSNELRLYLTSEDGDCGFPGRLHIEVIYTLNDKNELKISYDAITTKKTVINLSQRLFVNLEGGYNNEINNHILNINSKLYLPTDENKIPLGDIVPINNTKFDFKKGKIIGEQKLDNYFIIDNKIAKKKQGYEKGALLEDKKSGRIMYIYSTEPGFYIDSDKYGISIEPMNFPNSPNVGYFPNTILKPGHIYKQETIYKFDVK